MMFYCVKEINIEDYFVAGGCPAVYSRYFCKRLKAIDGVVLKLCSTLRRTRCAKPVPGDIYQFFPEAVS